MADTDDYNAEHLNYEAEVPEGGEGGDGAGQEDEMEDPELEDIKARVRAMEEEAEKLKLLQSEVNMVPVTAQ
jgi:polyadenylate-binding protein 2